MKKILISIIGAISLFAGTNPLFNDKGLDVVGKVDVANTVIWRGAEVSNKDIGVFGEIGLAYKGFYASVAGYNAGDPIVGSKIVEYKGGYNSEYNFENFGLPVLYGVNYKYVTFTDNTQKDFQSVTGNLGVRVPNVGTTLKGFYEYIIDQKNKSIWKLEDQYGVSLEQPFDTFIGNVKVEGHYAYSKNWSKEYGVSIANELKDDLWLSVGYEKIDYQSELPKQNDDFAVVKLTYNF